MENRNNTSLYPDYSGLDKKLAEKGKMKINLREDLNLSPGTVSKLGRGEFVNLKTLALICGYLDCAIEDVVEFKKR
ncbi:helix-turn-helix domain-containing protein [Alkalicoccobacillus murimartini]|uniref:DNA-binding Xre family transcriptional regulator n=1 Tax=Alkalicoccobacillus murimartini TaxID=171685 RepID=A0ABT9YM24_9BACI|nr:helix-turn-helix transcriptional regulator [Alkalicoccobacillus murimartini]MDQ0208927.1 DNA-binding Xre family transcriptional regulator [Alkalicoccobacillus murimartini]